MISLANSYSIMSWDDLKGALLDRWREWWVARHPPEVGLYSWVYLFERGKQIRPRLFCELWRYLSPATPVCVEGAFLLECAHVASLILDDLPWMDNAKERRDMMTLHCIFSVRKALLLVHDIRELAYQVAKACPLIRERAEALRKKASDAEAEEWFERGREKAQSLWYGQWLDLSRSGSLYEMAARKTGTLFEAVGEAVAVGVGLDPVFWKEWGRALGVLFQWVDDWDDREADAQMGQRNAFLEAPKETRSLYRTLWTHVVQGIGPGWWKTPFGAYLWAYFTRVLPMEAEQPRQTQDPFPSLRALPTLFHQDPPLPPLSLSSLPLLPCSPLSDDPCVLHPESDGLLFLQLFLPAMNRTSAEQEKKCLRYMEEPAEEEWSMEELWSIPEDQWLSVLEKRAKTQPEMEWILPSLRRVEELRKRVGS